MGARSRGDDGRPGSAPPAAAGGPRLLGRRPQSGRHRRRDRLLPLDGLPAAQAGARARRHQVLRRAPARTGLRARAGAHRLVRARPSAHLGRGRRAGRLRRGPPGRRPARRGHRLRLRARHDERALGARRRARDEPTAPAERDHRPVHRHDRPREQLGGLPRDLPNSPSTSGRPTGCSRRHWSSAPPGSPQRCGARRWCR